MAEWNAGIISEFRDNGGKVGGIFEGAPLLLLHHAGAKTGTPRVNPLMYQDLGSSYAIFASKAGAPTNPDWFYNLQANPVTTIEIGADTITVAARLSRDDEREAIWSRQKENFPQFAEYERVSNRQIPVIILEQRDSN
jgi:deazaflavin-dependent oxidoreductase (nitroreductase family)